MFRPINKPPASQNILRSETASFGEEFQIFERMVMMSELLNSEANDITSLRNLRTMRPKTQLHI